MRRARESPIEAGEAILALIDGPKAGPHDQRLLGAMLINDIAIATRGQVGEIHLHLLGPDPETQEEE